MSYKQTNRRMACSTRVRWALRRGAGTELICTCARLCLSLHHGLNVELLLCRKVTIKTGMEGVARSFRLTLQQQKVNRNDNQAESVPRMFTRMTLADSPRWVGKVARLAWRTGKLITVLIQSSSALLPLEMDYFKRWNYNVCCPCYF